MYKEGGNKMSLNSVPEFLEKLLINQYGETVYEEIISGLKNREITTFRVNKIKSTNKEIEDQLQLINLKYEKTLNDNAYKIEKDDENFLKNMDIYKDGKIYVQSLSSMIPPIILNPKQGNDILDMAAAPGGKTTQLASLTENKAHITACEVNKIRAERLQYNIEKQGASCVYCMIKDAKTIDDFFSFDQILLDAPCSGSGTLNLNDENLEKYFTEKLVHKSVETQMKLLNKAINILKPGGEMVYSTCSILDCENENIISNILKNNKVQLIPIETELINNIPMLPTKIPGTLCIKPNENFEGFFVAKLKKIK